MREKNILYEITYIWNLKKKMNEQNKQKTHRYREQSSNHQRERDVGEDNILSSLKKLSHFNSLENSRK